jgi:asparagine synthase (glutamine-hydrolysing)
VLLRRLAERALPKELDITRKQGFSIPLHTWFRGDWGRYMREILGQSPHFDRGVIQSLLKGQERGRANSQRLFALTMFELWMREYRVALP